MINDSKELGNVCRKPQHNNTYVLLHVCFNFNQLDEFYLIELPQQHREEGQVIS